MVFTLCLDAGIVKYSMTFCQHFLRGMAWGIHIVLWFTVYSSCNMYYNTGYVIQWCWDTWYICCFSALSNSMWTVGWKQYIIWWCCVASYFWMVTYIDGNIMLFSNICIFWQYMYILATHEKCLLSYIYIYRYSLKPMAKIRLDAPVAWDTVVQLNTDQILKPQKAHVLTQSNVTQYDIQHGSDVEFKSLNLILVRKWQCYNGTVMHFATPLSKSFNLSISH